MAAGFRIKIAGEDMGLFLPGRIDLTAAFALKATSGLNPLKVIEGLSELDPVALQAVAWFLTTHTFDETTQRYKPTGVNCDASTLNFALDDLETEPIGGEDPKSGTSTSDVNATSSS